MKDSASIPAAHFTGARRDRELTNRQPSSMRSLNLSLAKDNMQPQKSNVLASICFSKLPAGEEPATLHAPVARVPMASLDAFGAPGSISETWCAQGPFTYGQQNALRYCHNDEILFGLIQLPEAEFDTSLLRDAGKTPLQMASEHAYREIFKLTDALSFTSILRFWNYFADINGRSHGTERYRQFNAGRQDGFLAGARQITGSVPAASALGFADGPLTVYFFAARGVTPIAIENPRQVSAYQYPADYGPRSPTFSRASLVHLGDEHLLFLSGTASIVGHETLHVGDVVGQTRETVANIMEILAQANRVAPQARITIADLCCKVYVRHAKDVIAIHAELRRSLGESVRVTFLHADICRQDLLMEIEATAGHPFEFPVI